MCGIAGIIASNATKYELHIRAMVDVLGHRGPDANAIYLSENAAIGHTRLSIIDLADGKQPMKSSVTGAVITFNGEIYGYRKIRQNLAKEYPFRTHCDTEVVLALYDRYGVHMMPYLPGMFAFGIWNEQDRELFCARDRFGEKPLYYARGRNGEFLFASELKAILASGLVDPELNMASLAFYLKYRYVYPTQCIYQNIHVLPPGHCLRYGETLFEITRYWELPDINTEIEYGEAVSEFKRLFSESVRDTMIADVPVSVFLSGGLDSSCIVAEMSDIVEQVNTISFGFKDSHKNELPYAAEVAKMYGTNHVEIVDDSFDLLDTFVRMQSIYDEPFADHSNVPTYLICQKAHQYTKVAIGGDGGDELLAGYSVHRDMFELANEMKRSSSDIDRHALCAKHYNHGFYAMFSDDVVLSLGKELPEEFANCLKYYNTNTVDDSLRIDIHSFLMGDILVKTDRAAMANSLEMRTPFLTREFAEFCISLPWQFKINDQVQKRVMRSAYEKRWPASLLNRPKQGFGAPVGKWMKMPAFRALENEYIFNESRKMYQFLTYDSVKALCRKSSYYSWKFMVLSCWMEKNRFTYKG